MEKNRTEPDLQTLVVANGSITKGSEAGVTVVEREVAEEDFVRHSG
jgi:hypothetical protein